MSSRSGVPGFLNFRSKRRLPSIRRRIKETYAGNYSQNQGNAIKNPLELYVPTKVDNEDNCANYDPTTGQLRVMASNIDSLQNLMHSGTTAQMYDGSNNNLFNAAWGRAAEALMRKAASAYADGSSTLAQRGANNPNPRFISNAVCATNTVEPNTLSMSNMVWLWGQFVDHTVDLTDANPGEPANVLTGTSSPLTDPNEPYPDSTIMFNRSIVVAGSDPREQPNVISSFLDGTNVYGNSATRANTLRELDGTGKLKTSTGDLLPFNTFGLDNAMPTGATATDFFVAGDVRANENAFLTAMHTLWMREHNRQCDALLVEHPDWTGDDEKLFQQARHRVCGMIQHITYDAYLPALLGTGAIPVYTGYKPYTDASIATEFSTAGYRLGHAMIPSQLQVGPLVSDTELLRNLFFTPSYVSLNGIEGLLQGATRLVMKEINMRIVDDLRNFLFGPPGSGMVLDLATLNIQRGRDHGLPDYNTVRVAYGLAAKGSFASVTSDMVLQTALSNLYDSVGDIDPWVGCLAEDHVVGSGVGELVRTILVDQFSRVRDGDRFWYEVNVALSTKERDDIKATTLADVIRRNTGLSTLDIADDVFHV